MKNDKKHTSRKGAEKKGILREDDGKRTPPGPTGYITGGRTSSTRPEQGPDIPPQERTEGIP
ncbi:hypothetical protein ABID22_002900 [Pontibacter aydingkolensis]|uniref:Uncharacterized protein n=1 Tax=Pontibacter aydingkolensis TaxID=1911536 RepID=A0ABS7CX94_9BACT|nr:hypothetical protein [Pontibacter aydingkolensis]MBW7468483.1 hypothetical protein [Pontibacter aydingkolensis]